GPSRRKRHGFVSLWLGAHRARSTSSRTTASGTGSDPYCLCVLRARIASSTSTRRTVATWFNGPVAPQVEELADDKVKLTVDVPAHDVHHAVEHAASDLARTVRIPGFRKGKVPMPLLVQRIGRERIYEEAVDSHIGGWFWNAAARARVNPVAMPEYEFELPTSDKEDWIFTATVQVQPKPEPADWTTLEVPKHEVDVPQDVVQAELELLQKTAAELVG